MNLLRDASLDALLAFAEFAEDGNFSRAAIRLHISQPALHTKIAKLSRTLETSLYVRRGRSIEITESGRRVQRFAREMAAATLDFQNELLQVDTPQSVVLVAGEGSYLYLLGHGIRTHLARNRHSLRLLTADGVAAVEAVQSGRAHLGVASLDAVPDELMAQPLTRVGQVLVVPKRHPLASRRNIKLKDLNGEELIVPPPGRPHRTMLSRMLQSEQVDWRVAVEAAGWEVMLHLVRLGMGLAIVNACCRIPSGVVARPIPDLPALQYYVFSRSRKLPRAAQALKETLLASAHHWMQEA